MEEGEGEVERVKSGERWRERVRGGCRERWKERVRGGCRERQ